jgi:hypothetical protein
MAAKAELQKRIAELEAAQARAGIVNQKALTRKTKGI